MKRFLVSFLTLILLMPAITVYAERPSVIIDPGHGGKYTGTAGYSGNQTGYYEKHANLSVALKLRRLLEESGIEVLMTRTNDSLSWPHSSQSEELKGRMQLANSWAKTRNEVVFVSIHHNGSWNSSVQGIDSFYFDSDNYDPRYPPDPIQEQVQGNSKKLSINIHNSTVKQLQRPDRGTHPSNLYVVRNAQMPSTLVELGFMSNPYEERLIKTDSYQAKGAKGIHDGLITYFGPQKLSRLYVLDYNNKREVSVYNKQAVSLSGSSSVNGTQLFVQSAGGKKAYTISN